MLRELQKKRLGIVALGYHHDNFIPGSSDKDDLVHTFSTGDNVEVIEGELMNLQGKVLAVDGSKITMQPKHEDLKDPLEFQV